jgi:hypothetical protein
MQKRKLPIGIQTFSEIIEDNYYYVDKTPLIAQMINQGKYFFLSRPRRFGKSLLLDTIKCLVEGKRDLFTGLYAEKNWDWSKTFPVIRISFGAGVLNSREQLNQRMAHILHTNAEDLGLSINSEDDIPGQFASLIRDAVQKWNDRVVILIDEYDKPILDNLQKPDIAIAMRDGLKGLYSVIKDSDAYVKFSVITGVSKFSKVNLFSGANNYQDITLTPEYSSLCGYTDQDVDTVFAPELPGLDREEIRRWYNGYNWRGESVYNPFDALLLFREREFKPYWFETGTPTFLINLLREREFFTPNLTKLQTSSNLLSTFDVDNISEEALLFQTGYLTIRSSQEVIVGKRIYEMTYPNREVETSLNEALLPALGVNQSHVMRNYFRILDTLRNLDFADLHQYLNSLYAGIPHDWYRNNKIANYEGHYASVFYSHFTALGLHVTVEDANVNGKIDMTMEFNNRVFLIEFKVVEDAATGEALAQLKHKNYAEKYKAKNFPILLIGIEFSKTQKQIVGFETETIN